MKLFYITRELVLTSDDTYIHTGIEKKLLSQIDALKKNGVSVEVNGKSFAGSGLSMRNELLQRKELLHNEYIAIQNARKSYSESDVIYIRGILSYPLSWILVHLSRNTKIFIEMNGITLSEYISRIKHAKQLHHKIFLMYQTLATCFLEKSIQKHVDGIVSVTEEITSHYKNQAIKPQKFLTLGNGISVEQIPLRQCPNYNNELHVLIVGYLTHLHGVDRFIRGLDMYNDKVKTKVTLHVVGDGAILNTLKKLTLDLQIKNQVMFHGILTGEALSEIYNQCHIAIDALAGHRNNLRELSSLKSREYCARGIPFIMASTDADFPNDWPYVVHVPANESPIDMNTIISFAERVLSDEIHPQEMRKYAEERLDWNVKMKVLTKFLNDSK